MNGYFKRGTWFVVALFGWLALALLAQAASFDCGEAQSKVEKMICTSAELSRLDDALRKAYQQALERSDDKQKATEKQGQWLKEVRNPCQDVECLKKVYQARIQELTVAPLHSGASPQAESVTPASAGHYELVKGNGIEVCEAYKRNFAFFDNTIPMACERKYDPAIKGFSSPKWQKLDTKKYFELYKKAEIYLKEGWKGMSKEDVLNGIEMRAERQKIELNLARFDLDGDGKLDNILAVRDFGCGPLPSMAAEFRKTRLYVLNDTLTDIDYRRQDGWYNSYNNATIELYKGEPYVEHYEPDDNWGHLLTGSGRLYVMKEESTQQSSKEFPDEKVVGRLKSICEIQYVPSTGETK